MIQNFIIVKAHLEGMSQRKTYGELIQTVTSRNEAEYPKNGVKDGYYYIYQSAKPEISSIDVPDAAMVGQTIDITWESADSAENYKLERRVDSGGWTQVYAGVALVYNDRAQAEWTSVQYRVSASISGVYSTPMVSNTVSIIPTSALVISGTDGNLGTITAPVAYSVTSDTGNQITVTEIINGHERTLTPTSGQLITIPVSMLDLVQGESPSSQRAGGQRHRESDPELDIHQDAPSAACCPVPGGADAG